MPAARTLDEVLQRVESAEHVAAQDLHIPHGARGRDFYRLYGHMAAGAEYILAQLPYMAAHLDRVSQFLKMAHDKSPGLRHVVLETDQADSPELQRWVRRQAWEELSRHGTGLSVLERAGLHMRRLIFVHASRSHVALPDRGLDHLQRGQGDPVLARAREMHVASWVIAKGALDLGIEPDSLLVLGLREGGYDLGQYENEMRDGNPARWRRKLREARSLSAKAEELRSRGQSLSPLQAAKADKAGLWVALIRQAAALQRIDDASDSEASIVSIHDALEDDVTAQALAEIVQDAQRSVPALGRAWGRYSERLPSRDPRRAAPATLLRFLRAVSAKVTCVQPWMHDHRDTIRRYRLFAHLEAALAEGHEGLPGAPSAAEDRPAGRAACHAARRGRRRRASPGTEQRAAPSAATPAPEGVLAEMGEHIRQMWEAWPDAGEAIEGAARRAARQTAAAVGAALVRLQPGDAALVITRQRQMERTLARLEDAIGDICHADAEEAHYEEVLDAVRRWQCTHAGAQTCEQQVQVSPEDWAPVPSWCAAGVQTEEEEPSPPDGDYRRGEPEGAALGTTPQPEAGGGPAHAAALRSAGGELATILRWRHEVTEGATPAGRLRRPMIFDMTDGDDDSRDGTSTVGEAEGVGGSNMAGSSQGCPLAAGEPRDDDAASGVRGTGADAGGDDGGSAGGIGVTAGSAGAGASRDDGAAGGADGDGGPAGCDGVSESDGDGTARAGARGAKARASPWSAGIISRILRALRT